MKFGAFTAILSLTICVAIASHGSMEVDQGNFKINWLYNKTFDNLTFHLEVKATGWVGFGFALKAPTGMNNYDIVVGGVTDAGANYLNDYYSTSKTRPPPDSSQDYTLLNASESGGWTRLSFTRKSNTGDDMDVQLTAGTPVHLIYAYKNLEDADGSTFFIHDKRGNTNMVVLVPAQTVSPSPTLMTMMSTPVPTTRSPLAYTNSLTMDDGNFKVYWNYDKAKAEYLFHLKVKATGWVALGFANEAPNSMKDYDVAVGGVNKNGTAYINDYYTTGQKKPPLDTEQNFELMKGQENGGYTEIWFKRKTDTMDSQKDLKLSAGSKVFIVWAYHSNMEAEDPTTFPYHSKRGVSMNKLDLSTGGVSLATFSFGVILTNLLIAVRYIL